MACVQDVYFRWYDLNIKDKEQQNDRKERQPFVALQAAIRRNTENSVSKEHGNNPPSTPSGDSTNGTTAVVEEKIATADTAKLSVSAALNGSIGT